MIEGIPYPITAAWALLTVLGVLTFVVHLRNERRWRRQCDKLVEQFTIKTPVNHKGLPFVGASSATEGYSIRSTTWCPKTGTLTVNYTQDETED